MTAEAGTATQLVAAPPERVWRMVSDVTRIGEWSPETESAQWLDGEPGSVGARFRGRNRRGRASWSTTCEVVESVPGRSFAFVVGSVDKPATHWRYELTPVEGGTLVTESFALAKRIGLFSRLTTRLLLGVPDRQADLTAGMEQTLQRLAAAAQGARAPG